jgi:hypothetical protein
VSRRCVHRRAGLGSVSLLLVASAACGDVRTNAVVDDAGDGAGTGSDAGGMGVDGGGEPDAGMDAGADDCAAWEPAVPFEPCDIAAADRGGDLFLMAAGTYTYDSETDELLDPNGDAVEHVGLTLDVAGEGVRAISGSEIFVAADARLQVRGSEPVLLVAWQDLSVQGEIDASSAGGPGPGANPTVCEGAGQTGGDGLPSFAGGGGGGGGFVGLGGDGGTGAGSSNQGFGGSSVPPPETLRGGCAGGRGGVGDAPSTPGGAGGGALALSARSIIIVTGTVHAGGAGGTGGLESGGGGGGGSGGMLWLDAPQVGLADPAVLAANGGGGAAGAAGTAAGGDGEAGRADGGQASGGLAPGATAGGGGAGSADELAGSPGQSNTDGGGGGGGGAGVIRIDGALRTGAGTLIVPPL